MEIELVARFYQQNEFGQRNLLYFLNLLNLSQNKIKSIRSENYFLSMNIMAILWVYQISKGGSNTKWDRFVAKNPYSQVLRLYYVYSCQKLQKYDFQSQFC